MDCSGDKGPSCIAVGSMLVVFTLLICVLCACVVVECFCSCCEDEAAAATRTVVVAAVPSMTTPLAVAVVGYPQQPFDEDPA